MAGGSACGVSRRLRDLQARIQSGGLRIGTGMNQESGPLIPGRAPQYSRHVF